MLPQANKWKAQRELRSRLKRKTKRDIDKWEKKSSVAVDFRNNGFVYLSGDFFPKELADIARIARAIKKETE